MIKRSLNTLWRHEHGQDLVEYSLLLGFLTLASLAAITGLSSAVRNVLSTIAGDVNSAATAIS